jgi:hypothetical protein
MIRQHYRHPIDADHEGLHDGMREVKPETFAAVSSLQFDATYERTISTLRASFEAQYHKFAVTGRECYSPNFPAEFSRGTSCRRGCMDVSNQRRPRIVLRPRHLLADL